MFFLKISMALYNVLFFIKSLLRQIAELVFCGGLWFFLYICVVNCLLQLILLRHYTSIYVKWQMEQITVLTCRLCRWFWRVKGWYAKCVMCISHRFFCVTAMHRCPSWSLNFDAYITFLGFVWVYGVCGYLGSEGPSRCGNSGGVCCKRTQCENVWLSSKLFVLCQFGTCIKLSETFNICANFSAAFSKSKHNTLLKLCLFFITFFMLKTKTHFQEGKFQDLKSTCL